jgi:subtilisin family serine protease
MRRKGFRGRVSPYVAALLLVSAVAFVQPGSASPGSRATGPSPSYDPVETKVDPRLWPWLNRSDLVGVIVSLSDQPSLEITRSLRPTYQARLDEIAARIRDLGARYHESLSPGASRDEVRAAAQREYAAMTPADREMLRELDLEAKDLRRQLRDEAARLIRARIEPQQQRVADFVYGAGGGVAYRYTAVNALAAQVPGPAIPGLADMPDVVCVALDEEIPALLNTSVYSIRADTFWGAGFPGTNAIGGIVDTGVDTTHPALSATTWTSHTFHDSAQNQPDYGDNASSTDDLQGHGTHVAGIVASRNATYRGVSYGSVQALNLKAGFRTKTGDGAFMLSDVMAAVDWAVATSAVRPDALNFSAGGLESADDSPPVRFWDAVVDDADAFTTPAAIAAGNSGPDSMTLSSPAIGYNVLCVAGAYDGNTSNRADDTIYVYSSRGPTAGGRKKPDLTVPAQSITSCNYDWEDAGDFVTMSGTSMAAPHATGALLLLADAGIFDAVRQKAILLNACEDMGDPGWDAAWGWGYLDMWYAYYHRNDSLVGTVYPAGNPNDFRLYRADGAVDSKFTLVWNRHVNYAGASYPSTYYDLNNLNLRLYAEADNVMVDSSVSSIDNVEQVVSDRAGSEVIKIDAASATFAGVSYEGFALAGDAALTAATGPALSIPAQSAYTPTAGQDFVVTVNVQNQGDLDAHACSAQLSLPAGVALISGANPQSVGTIASEASGAATWTLRVTSPDVYAVAVSATSSSYGESWSASGAVDVDASGPRLSGGGFDPADPATYGPATTFRFYVHYYDAGNVAPSAVTAVIDGVPHAMALASGAAYNGDYEFLTTVSLGAHAYSFQCTYGAGLTDSLPDAGTLDGPFVCRAVIDDGAEWTATASVNVRVYARGATAVYLKPTYSASWQGPFAYTPTETSVVIPWALSGGADGLRHAYAMCKIAGTRPSNVSVDSITLDTTAAPSLKSFNINLAAQWTSSRNVTIRVYPDCATDVRFKHTYAGAWSAWQPLPQCNYGILAWALADGPDGPRAVYAQARDHHGNVSAVRCHTIVLDTAAAPVVKSFTIDGGATQTASRTVELRIFPDCATDVRMKNGYADPWGAWQPIAQCNYAQLSWTLADGPDGQRAVYVQARDHHGNTSAVRCHTIELITGG